jgi:hypothetical protein
MPEFDAYSNGSKAAPAFNCLFQEFFLQRMNALRFSRIPMPLEATNEQQCWDTAIV